MMPVGTYVRYWDGRTVGYGKITEEKEKTYVVEVGGTGTKDVSGMRIELGKGHVTYHPALIANGLVESLKKKRLKLDESRYVYHATSATNLPYIKQNGLMPRTMVNWKQMGKEVWRGAEIANDRAPNTDDPLAEHYAQAQQASQKISQTSSSLDDPMEVFHQGDVGDYIYGTTKKDIAVNYAMDVIKKGQKAVVLRFKAGKSVWYDDPKSTAIRAVATITGTRIEKLDINITLGNRNPSDPRDSIEIEDEVADQLDRNPWQPL